MFFSVDDNVHSPVWAALRWFDGVGGGPYNPPSLGKRRRFRRSLGEGGGGDGFQLYFPGKENKTIVPPAKMNGITK